MPRRNLKYTVPILDWHIFGYTKLARLVLKAHRLNLACAHLGPPAVNLLRLAYYLFVIF